MKSNKFIKIDIHALYQLLISECRYGYTRNNHLMPGTAYNRVEMLLSDMYKCNKDVTLHTVKQLCEECISFQLNTNFYDGLDDEFHNREEAEKFVGYLLNFLDGVDADIKYFPYNEEDYWKNIERKNNLKYRLYELDSFNEDANKVRELTTEATVFSEIEKLFVEELKSDTIVFHKMKLKSKKDFKIVATIYKIISPTTHKDKIYMVEVEL